MPDVRIVRHAIHKNYVFWNRHVPLGHIKCLILKTLQELINVLGPKLFFVTGLVKFVIADLLG